MRRMLRAALSALWARLVITVSIWRWGTPHSCRHVCSVEVATPECDTTITVSLTCQPASCSLVIYAACCCSFWSQRLHENVLAWPRSRDGQAPRPDRCQRQRQGRVRPDSAAHRRRPCHNQISFKKRGQPTAQGCSGHETPLVDALHYIESPRMELLGFHRATFWSNTDTD